jgi:hypothetical protein
MHLAELKLRESAQHRPLNAEWLLKDPDLDSVRGTAWFAAIIREAEAAGIQEGPSL